MQHVRGSGEMDGGEGDQLENLGIDLRIILKWILKE
jgi:hypothetical protein